MKLFDAALTDIAYEVVRRTSGKLPHDSCATFHKSVFEIQPWKRVHNRCLRSLWNFLKVRTDNVGTGACAHEGDLGLLERS
jgi:hypothetical protein